MKPGVVLALVAGCVLAGCGSKDEVEPKAPASGSAVTTPLAGADLIAFEQVEPGAEENALYVVGSDGKNLTLIRRPGAGPQWSPDGATLAFQACLNPPDCTTDVVLLDRSSGEPQGFSSPDSALEIHCGLAWAPDGKNLACETFGVDDPNLNGIYSIRTADGEGLTRITKNPGGDDLPLAYSPDGSQLLLSREDPSRAEESNHALFIAPVTGGEPHRITPWGYADDSAGWSPDGSTIVFGKDGSLYRVKPSGQGLAAIRLETPDGANPNSAFDVGFSPDGQRIIFSLGGPAPGLYTASPMGDDVKRLTSGDHHHAKWGAAPGS